jgi:hypothetical protein
MENCKIPNKIGCSIKKENNLFLCQFPFDTNNNVDNTNLFSYKNIIVYSEFVEKYLLRNIL